MNSAAVEALLKDVEEQLSSYNKLLEEAYKYIDEKPVTVEDVKAFFGYKPKSRELTEAGRYSVRARDKYEAQKNLNAQFDFDRQGAELLRLMEREAEDTIFEDGGASEAKYIAGAIGRHIEAFNMIAPARARQLYMKYSQQHIENSKQKQSDRPNIITGLVNIADYMGITVNTLRTAIKNGIYKGFIYRVGNSRWQIDTDKYKQFKYDKL